MSDQIALTVEDLKTEVLPRLFDNPDDIGQYGHGGAASAVNSVSDLLERSPVTRLAEHLGRVMSQLADADPQKLAKPAGWLDRFLGRPVEVRVRYHAARRDIDALLEEADVLAQSVRDTVRSLDTLITEHRDEAERLRMHVDAGRSFMVENPKIGLPAGGVTDFENHRERFARKLANLATLQASHDMSFAQMKLTRAHAVDLLDRYEQASRVLVPVWRQHTLALMGSKNMDPRALKEASRAHDALLRSLAQSMDAVHGQSGEDSRT